MTRWLVARVTMTCGMMLGVSAALAVALHHATAGPPTRVGPVVELGSRERLPRAELLSFAPPPPDEFAELTERPPFSPSRRPPLPRIAIPPPPAEPAPPPRPKIRLFGVGVLENGASGQALLARDGSGKAEWLREGDTIEGWRLLAVEPRRVRLRDDRDNGPDMVLELLIEGRGDPAQAGSDKPRAKPRRHIVREQPHRAERPAAK